MLHAVITTIQRPTPCVNRLIQAITPLPARLVIAGDTKGPDAFDVSQIDSFDPSRLDFLDIQSQHASGFSIAPLLPTKHYCRKNIGYLHSIRAGATCIYETDDDNAPLERWSAREEWVQDLRFVDEVQTQSPRWVNAYQHFTDGRIWPRGLPLDCIDASSTVSRQPSEGLAKSADAEGRYWAPIQQGLADGAPDVDAVWRLVMDRDFQFDVADSVMLAPGQWCPFNTQTTWWWPNVYPLLYVPSYCSFRMCDIWKSFVAQRCLWELETGIVFHASEVVQERNPHNLMRDFEDEIPGYLQNHRLAMTLESVSLRPGVDNVGANLLSCYKALVGDGFFPEKELPLVEAWLADVSAGAES
ncbi:MAG: DUF288 domain-containing protein [Planctomycetales bacterium]|nr:DUF288 domain-containing protein [Planctomycetales bacterium]